MILPVNLSSSSRTWMVVMFEQETPKLKVAIVGLGIGRHHLEAYGRLPEHFEVVALCDIDRAKAQATAESYGIGRITADLTELCRLDELDVIDICTPPHLHAPQAQQVLAAGKHVICEKPLANSLAAVDALIASEAQSGRRVMPIFQYRFGHGAQKLRTLIEQGLAGRAYLATVETAWRRRAEYYAVPWRGKWKTELGGAIVGHAIHGHDLLNYILGPSQSVFDRIATLVNDIEVEDCASISLQLADGSFASLSVTLGSPVEISRHRFCFSNLVAESNLRPYTSSGDPWQFTGDTPELTAQIEAALATFQPQPEGFAGQFLRFHQALQQGHELPVTLPEARRSIELITAIYHSAQTRQPVELPLGADHPKYRDWTLGPD
jgi:predicted dehydrogenase